jgi:hypothetical protein
MLKIILSFLLAGPCLCGAAVLRWDFSSEPSSWIAAGATDLFQWNRVQENIAVTWDSSKPNSFYSIPLPATLDGSQSFSFQFDIALDEIMIGTDPDKPYTFQIAAGFFDSASVGNPEFYRGSGMDSIHGPRNLLEFNYFADSGFGATVAPAIVSSDNQVFFSDNHPLEMLSGNVYTIRIAYDGPSRTVQSAILRNGEPDGINGDGKLRTITLPSRFSDFRLNRFGILSYSDAGQSPAFGGSLLARGTVDNVELVLPEPPRPRLELAKGEGHLVLVFSTAAGYNYQLETSVNLTEWEPAAEPAPGTGGSIEISYQGGAKPAEFFRLRISPQ